MALLPNNRGGRLGLAICGGVILAIGFGLQAVARRRAPGAAGPHTESSATIPGGRAMHLPRDAHVK